MRTIYSTQPNIHRGVSCIFRHASQSNDERIQSDHHFCHHPCHKNGLFSKIKPITKQKIKAQKKPLSRHAGIALPLVLIFFVVMTLMGVTAIRNATSGEKLAGNARNQQMAFQAAEQALRHCEVDLQTSVKNGATSTYESLTLKPIPIKPYGVKSPPQCRATNISDSLQLGPTEVSRDESIYVYQITARGTGPSDIAVVMLQSSLRFRK